jgi:SAM-dependent methyltransferase
MPRIRDRFMTPKPIFLGPKYAEQFRDASVAAAYRKRPPYPPELFEILAGLLPIGNRCLVDLGAGTGEVAIPMSRTADVVHAVEPSPAMLAIGRRIPGSERVSWFNGSAEEFTYPRQYGLIVCAQSLGWMDWELVFPKLARSLHPEGYLALVEQDQLSHVAWQADLRDVVSRYSTNQDFVPFDLIEGIVDRGLFRKVGSVQTAAVPFVQTVTDFIDSIHARNGFSRDRMTPAAAESFDRAVRDLLTPHHPDGVLRGDIRARVTWGRPM